MFSKSKTKAQTPIMQYVKGTAAAVISSLLLILIFALCIRFFKVPTSAIKPVNIVIKIVSIAVGVLIATGDGTKGIKKGAIVGGIYIALAFTIFSILSNTFLLSWTVLTDLIFGIVAGIVAGIVFVNIRR